MNVWLAQLHFDLMSCGQRYRDISDVILLKRRSDDRHSAQRTTAACAFRSSMNSYVLKGTFKPLVDDEIKETPIDTMMFVSRGVAQNAGSESGEFLGRYHARLFGGQQRVFRHDQPSCPSRPLIVS